MFRRWLMSVWNKIRPWVSKGIDFFNQSSPREKKLFCVLGVAFALLLDYWILVGPTLALAQTARPRMAQTKKEIIELRNDIEHKDLIEKKWTNALAQKEEALRRLVPADQMSVFLEALSRLAADAHVRLVALRPLDNPSVKIEKTAQMGPHPLVTIRVNALAGAHELGRFLEKLENDKFYVRVEKVSIKAGTDTVNPKCNAELDLAVFRK